MYGRLVKKLAKHPAPKVCGCRPPKKHRDCLYCGCGGPSTHACGVCKENGVDAPVIRGTERRTCDAHKKPADNGPAETHVIEFSINFSKDSVKTLCERNGLTVDPNYSLNNGGVTRGLRITGPREVLRRLARKFGYPGQNPDLE